MEGMIEGKKIAGCFKNVYVEQIKSGINVKIYRELKQKASNRLEWRFGVVNQPSGREKNKLINNIKI